VSLIHRSSGEGNAASAAGSSNDWQQTLQDGLKASGKKSIPAIDKALNDFIVSPSQHSVGYAELLSHKLHHLGEMKHPAEVIEQSRALLLAIPQGEISKVTKALTNISRQMTRAAILCGRTIRVIAPLKAIVEKITAVYPSILTGIHVDLLLVVLKCHAYDLVRSMTFLSNQHQPLQVSPKTWPCEVVDYLQYCLYLGNFHAAEKKFKRAVESFTLAFAIPTNGTVSAVQLAAYKKMILTSILATGDVVPLHPRLTNPAMLRHLDMLSGPYLDLAKSYRKCAQSSLSSPASQSALSELTHVVESSSELFNADMNLGLVKQILASITPRHIAKLTQTYLTVSIQDIAQRLRMGQQQQQSATAAQPPMPTSNGTPAQLAERQIFNMINTKSVFARLDSSSGMVSFLDDPEEYDSAECQRELDGKIGEMMTLSNILANKEKELQLTPTFLIKTGQAGGRATGAAGGGGAGSAAAAAAYGLDDMRGEYGHGAASYGMEDDYEDEDSQLRRAMEASLMQQ